MKTRDALTILLLIAGIAVLGGAPTFGQPIPPAETERPDPNPGGAPDTEIPLCASCCGLWAAPSCRDLCNCDKVPDAHPCAVSSSSEKYARTEVSKLEQWAALAAIWDALVERYPEHAEAYRKYNGRIASLYVRNPGLAKRSARFVAGIAPGMAASLAGDTKAEQAESFDASDLKLLRGVLRDLGRLERRSFDGGLADAIETMVLPGVSDVLVGKTHMEALDCVLTAKCGS